MVQLHPGGGRLNARGSTPTGFAPEGALVVQEDRAVISCNGLVTVTRTGEQTHCQANPAPGARGREGVQGVSQ